MAAPATASAARSCAPRFQTTLLRSNANAEVYLRNEKLYACLRNGGRSVYLDRESRLKGGRDSLTGTVLAYDEPSPVWEPRIVVRSISTGRVLHKVKTRVERSHGANLDEVRILELAVAATGAVAWIQQDSGAGRTVRPAEYGVYAVDGQGFHAPQTGLNSRPSRLRITGDVLSWVSSSIGARQTLELD